MLVTKKNNVFCNARSYSPLTLSIKERAKFEKVWAFAKAYQNVVEHHYAGYPACMENVKGLAQVANLKIDEWRCGASNKEFDLFVFGSDNGVLSSLRWGCITIKYNKK